MSYTLHPVETDKDRTEFLDLVPALYEADPNWIRPLDDDINKVFNPKKNKLFRQGEARRWILRNPGGRAVGRVAAFINSKTANDKHNKQPTGGMGFFECINDQLAANLLFDACRNWLSERGMGAMDGPVNFGERQQFWGLLVEGFEPPCYQMNYNPPYYRALFENYGFKLYFNQFSYGLDLRIGRPEKYHERYRRLSADPDYSFRHLRKKELAKYAEDFRTIFNKAFAGRGGDRGMSSKAALALMTSMKPVIIEHLMWFAYYKDEPIAFYINLPELNHYFKHVNGNMNWLGKLKFLWHFKVRNTNNKYYGLVFGVIPEFHAKGVEGAIIVASESVIMAPGRPWIWTELVWIGDFNPKMMRVAENLGADIIKTHVTYRCLFDRNAPFERYPLER